MPGMTASKSLELKSFWRAKLRHKDPAPTAKVLFRRGVPQVDGYGGFERLMVRGEIVLAACSAHARRKFYEFHQATGSPIAAEVIRHALARWPALVPG